jgi:long-chain acyl-CoA synthetase
VKDEGSLPTRVGAPADIGAPADVRTPADVMAWTNGRTVAWLARQVELGVSAADLSLPQYRLLSLLAQGSAVSSVVARWLTVRPPSVTAVVDGLVGRGLVERRHVEDDRRCVVLTLTAQGERALGEADAAVELRLSTLLADLRDQREADRALAGLVAWRDAMTARARGTGLR